MRVCVCVCWIIVQILLSYCYLANSIRQGRRKDAVLNFVGLYLGVSPDPLHTSNTY